MQRRRAQAVALVQQLTENEGPVLIEKPTQEQRTHWRKVVDYARRHDLLPAGYRIEKGMYYGQLTIRLVQGVHANSKPPAAIDLPVVAVPRMLRAPHPVVAVLRDDRGRLVMPKATRHRSLLILLGLAAEAARRGHQVRAEPVPDRYHHHYYAYRPRDDGPRYSRRDAELKITVDGFGYTVTIQQVNPKSEDDERITRLAIELTAYQAEGRQYRWADGKKRRVEDALGSLLHEIETRAAEDRQRQIDEERAKAERKVPWEHAMDLARRKATEAHYATVLDAQVARWQRARLLREFRDELDLRLSNERSEDGDLTAARGWLSWIEGHLDRADPIENPPSMPSPPTLKPADLAPFLHGWSPHSPEQHRSRW